MTMHSRLHHAALLRNFGTLFVVAVALNYFWELAQSPLFAGMGGLKAMWWHCFVASLGDGVLVWIIYVAGCAVFRRSDWFVRPGAAAYGVMLVTGLTIAVAVEWIALHLLRRWTYAPDMPLLPGIDIGLVPVLQMLILPPAIFYIAAAWSRRGKVRLPE